MIIRKLYRRIRKKLISNDAEVFLLEGIEKSSQARLKIIFVGDVRNRNYLSDLAFDSLVSMKEIRHIKKRRVTDIIPALQNQADLLIVKTVNPEEFSNIRNNGFLLPIWFEAECVFRLADERLSKSKGMKKVLQKIKKNGFKYNISRNKSDFDYFYHEMYLPTVKRAHEDRAIIMPYEEMIKKIDQSELMQVTLGDDIVSASIILYGDKDVRHWKHGVKNGSIDLKKKGCVSALRYFEIGYLKEKGYTTLNHGGTRSFLSDGVLKYKKQWGMRLGNHWNSWFYLKPNGQADNVIAFLKNNPFIFMNGNDYYGAVFISDAIDLEQTKLDRMVKDFYIEGMCELKVYYPYHLSEIVSKIEGLQKRIAFVPFDQTF